MKKTYTIEQLEDKKEYFTKMQKGLGHHSWWYTNRGSDNCINVKVHIYNKHEPIDYLTEKEKELIKVLDIDTDNIANDYFYEHLQAERDGLNMDIEAGEYPQVDSVEYGGRSGGWLCVVYNFDDFRDFEDAIENEAYTLASMLADKMEQVITDTTEKIKKAHKALCVFVDSEEYSKDIAEVIRQRIDIAKESAIETYNQITK